MAASIALKLSRGDETRVLSLPVHPVPAWQDFAASLAERFQLDDGPSAVTYLDHEGDQITVSSDVELKDMWHSFAGKSSVSVGVLAPFVEADRSAATEKLLESIRDAVAADPSVAFDIHGILAGSAFPPQGPPHGGRHCHHGGPPGGPRGGRGGGRGGRGGWHGHGHGHGRDGPTHPGAGHFPFFPPPPPPPFGDFMHARGAPPPPPFGRHHPHGPPPPPPFCGRRHPHWHREESDSSESSDSSSSDSSDSESTHRRHGVPRRHRHRSRGHGRETARRSRTLASPY
ncbi:hypothetical protein JCM8115_004878 [Rhodotorula mucilaginosa]